MARPGCLRLIGFQQWNRAADDHQLIADLFRQLPSLARPAAPASRLLGYESVTPGRDRLRFFGLVVESLPPLPAGMVAWELAEKTWTVWAAERGRTAMVWEESISWRWATRPPGSSVPCLGEFVAHGRAGPQSLGPAADRDFQLFALVPVAGPAAGFRDEVQLADPNPSWSARFAELAASLQAALGPRLARRIEHYGSTAVPGLTAKPIIDVLVEVPSFAEARRRVFSCLTGDQWEYWWYADHMVFFQRAALMGERVAHVHFAPAGHPVWEGLAFRDQLRADPAAAAEYAALKRQLAAQFRDDREAYTRAKTEFVRALISRAPRSKEGS
jgi:GrpB-like predicted nucleotidyltransferase (UPF0157 family)